MPMITEEDRAFFRENGYVKVRRRGAEGEL